SAMRVAIEQASGEKYRSMCRLHCFFVPFRIIILSSFLVSRDFFRNGTKTTTATGAEAARAAARLRSRDRAAARHRKLLARRLRSDFARRSERSDRHESAEPLWRVR